MMRGVMTWRDNRWPRVPLVKLLSLQFMSRLNSNLHDDGCDVFMCLTKIACCLSIFNCYSLHRRWIWWERRLDWAGADRWLSLEFDAFSRPGSSTAVQCRPVWLQCRIKRLSRSSSNLSISLPAGPCLSTSPSTLIPFSSGWTSQLIPNSLLFTQTIPFSPGPILDRARSIRSCPSPLLQNPRKWIATLPLLPSRNAEG